MKRSFNEVEATMVLKKKCLSTPSDAKVSPSGHGFLQIQPLFDPGLRVSKPKHIVLI